MNFEWNNLYGGAFFTVSHGRKAKLEILKIPNKSTKWALSIQYKPRIEWIREYDIEVVWPLRNCPHEILAMKIAEDVLRQEWSPEFEKIRK